MAIQYSTNLTARVSGSGSGMGLSFQRDTLNNLFYEYAIQNLNPLMQYFNTFGMMKLNHSNQFELAQILGSDLMLSQQGTGCTWTPVDPFSSRRSTITPYAFKNHTQVCKNEKIIGYFTKIIEWFTENEGMIGLQNVNNQEYLAMLLAAYMDSIYQSYMSASANAGLYTNVGTNPVFRSGVSANEQTRWNEQQNIGLGYVAFMKSLVATYPNFNVSGGIVAGDLAQVNSRPTLNTSFKVIFDRLYTAAPEPLRAMINQGELVIGGKVRSPQVVCDTYTFNNLVALHRTQGDDPKKEYASIRKEKITVPHNEIVGRSSVENYVYYINDIPVVVDHTITQADNYVQGGTFFMAITVSENINRGCSFGNADQMSALDVPLKMYQNTEDPSEEGILKIKSNGLFASAISDPNLIVAATQSIKWA